jgi:hypothetical protein
MSKALTLRASPEQEIHLEGRLHRQEVLTHAVDEVEEHLREHFEEWE